MFNKKEIFVRAWAIKRQDARNIFSICLKMAWNEAKANANKTAEERKIEELSERFSRWTKDGDNGKHYDRIYFNAEDFGLEVKYYNTGNVSRAWLNGEHISNSKASALLGGKAYLDLVSGKLYISPMMEQYFGDEIREAVAV